ncbi:MAG: Ig-like domain-containing protein [Candidatus Dormibacter sp.]
MTARAVASTSRRPCPGPTDLAADPARPLRRTARALILCIGAATLCIALSGCFSAPPQIISLEPNRGSTGVPADAPVRVIFDRPVLRSSVVGRFTVDPAIPGCDLAAAFTGPAAAPCSIRWLDPVPGFELLHTGSVFAPLTKYTLTLAGGFTDPQGDRNGLDHHWDLTSAPSPRVTATAPADRSGGVAVDAPLAVSFSAPMDARSTAAAITLSPAVPGTQVSRNTLDHSRFAILPGQLLEPGVAYTITVAASARGEDQQALAVTGAVRFTTTARLGGSHAVVLAGAPGANSTEVLLPALAPAAAGDPIAAPVLLQAPVCTASLGCGVVAAQAPLSTYEAAALSPDGTHIAVVVDDATGASAQLEVVDTIRGTTVTRIPGGVRPSWSPDSSQLALVTGSSVEVLNVASGLLTVVDSPVGLRAPPLWSGPSTLILSTAVTATSPSAVELVNLLVGARYSLPGVPSGSIAAAVSPSGSRLAIATPAGSTLVAPAAGAAGTAQTLPGHLDAIGFAGEGTLMAINPESEQLVRASVSGGDSTAVSLTPAVVDLSTVRVTPDGRRIVYLAFDVAGGTQAFVANADGTGGLAITRLLASSGLVAQTIDFAG